MSAPPLQRSNALNLTPHSPACPMCQQRTFRVHRRPIDLLFSVFIPIWRFRCEAMGCPWEGNVRISTLSHKLRRQ